MERRGHGCTARATWRAEKVGDSYHRALCQLDLSEIYLELNLNQDAAELARDAFTRFQKLAMGYEAAKALCGSAIAVSQQGHELRCARSFRARLEPCS